MSSTDSFTVTVVESSVTISGTASSNSVKVTVTKTGDKVKARLTLRIPCGPHETDLIDSKDAPMSVSNPLDNLQRDSPPDKMEWRTTARGVDIGPLNPVEFELTDFVADTAPGTANLILEIQVRGVDKVEKTVPVTKLPPPASDNPKVHYFKVNPDYVLEAGTKKVTVSFCVTGYDTVRMYRNNKKVETSELSIKKTGKTTTGFLEDHPSITSAYRFEGKGEFHEKDNSSETRWDTPLYRTVQVISPGWNQIALRQGSPIRLYESDDLIGKERTDADSGARLYGIFRAQDGTYALYSSETGVDDWLPEKGKFKGGSEETLKRGEAPEKMATSPGVVYKNKLWLIGGSSVKSNRHAVGDQIWSYGKHEGEEIGWKKRVPEEGPKKNFSKRMGHACIVVNNEIWILGGYENGKKFNDVWRLSEDNAGNLHLNSFDQQCWGKNGGRCNPAATTLKNSSGETEVWIYGGSEAPQGKGLYDFWVKTEKTVPGKDEKEWQPWKRNTVADIKPDLGVPLGSSLVSYTQSNPAGEEKFDRVFLMGSFSEWATAAQKKVRGNRSSSFLMEWHPGTESWESRPVIDGWQQFRGSNFYMQAVAFHRFIFVWSLQDDDSSEGKLNILVSH
jgi:hypothetical protein